MKNEKIHKLEIDTEKRKFILDNRDVGKSITKISIDITAGELSKAIIEMDSNVVIKGTLLNTTLEPLLCEKCGTHLGEFVGRYSVICPECDELNLRF